MTYPEMPVPFGVFRAVKRPTYEKLLDEQVALAIEKKGRGNLEQLLFGAETWRVE